MYYRVRQRLAQFAACGKEGLLRGGRIGLEKECLRVGPEGRISQANHPFALGSPLTHPYITTDYSEALLELITPPFDGPAEALAFLRDIQHFVYENLGDEYLWATSMPCVVQGEQSVRIAEYGSSNAGMMKTVYRRGLGYRYGRVMQVIAGVHFNYSFSDDFWATFQALEGDARAPRQFISDRYFGLLRNLQRLGWLIPYLFGASPAVCKSFLTGKNAQLEEFDADTYYGPYATSLRMGDIGYQNNKENEVGIKACYDSLDEYVETLTYAIETPYPGYRKIGVKVDGEYRQLNANLLQIENEYYSTVRPKQLLEDDEKPTHALKRRGVQYVELRSLDVNAFDPLGINEDQLRFLEALMIFCMLDTSHRIHPWERAEIDKNEMLAAHCGREPGLTLMRNGEEITLREWALEICDGMAPVCEVLDQGQRGRPYGRSLAQQLAAVEEPDRTPSARMLGQMRERKESFFSFASRLSRQHQTCFADQPLDAERRAFFAEVAERSLERQWAMEAADTLSFDDYVARYLSQQL